MGSPSFQERRTAEGAATAGDDAAFLLLTAWKAPPWLMVGLTALAAGAFGLAHA